MSSKLASEKLCVVEELSTAQILFPHLRLKAKKLTIAIHIRALLVEITVLRASRNFFLQAHKKPQKKLKEPDGNQRCFSIHAAGLAAEEPQIIKVLGREASETPFPT